MLPGREFDDHFLTRMVDEPTNMNERERQGAGAVPVMTGKPADEPSPWVCRWLPQAAGNGRLLDFASGTGRHVRLAVSRGYEVLALDRNPAVRSLAGMPGVEARVADLEADAWTWGTERFAVIVVTRYLFRSRLDLLVGLLAEGGCLIYETYAAGHGRYGKPSRPEHLLQADELLTLARRAALRVCAFEQGLEISPREAIVQRMVAWRGTSPAVLR
ncbi:MAG: SAM-dependent methyltransferase [Lautropia sp.]|nr:SAM-dependent methyltransferase [Lautropia sp.]